MFVPRAFGRCFPLHTVGLGSRTIRQSAPLLSSLQKARWTPIRIQPSLSTSQRATYADAKVPKRGPGKQSAYAYPENLNVFNSGSVPVLASGFLRIVCLAVFGYGSLYVAPYVFQDEVAPWYLAPVIAIGASIPLLFTGLAFGGYAFHVNLLLPNAARRSKDDLMRFVSNMPPNALIQIKSMWLRPWPVTKTVFFEDFRRLPRSWWRMTNLEHVPRSNREVEHKANPMSNWLVRKIFGSFFVSRSQFKDRSRAPGVWNKVWEQIPTVDEVVKQREAMDLSSRAPVVAANRPSPPTGKAAQTPQKDQAARPASKAVPKKPSTAKRKP